MLRVLVSSIHGRRAIGRLVLESATVFGRACHLGMQLGPSQPPTLCWREMSTGQGAVMLCGWE